MFTLGQLMALCAASFFAGGIALAVGAAVERRLELRDRSRDARDLAKQRLASSP